MRTKTLPGALVILTVATLLAMPFAAAAARSVHFGLARSVPAADATVHQVPEVRLWFSEAPADGSVSVRLLDAAGDLVDTSDPTRDAEDATVFVVRPRTPPGPGAYKVSWRGMGADGHVVRGDFAFSVAAH
ncbi:MAG: hypothetical protein AMXMBFR53_31600 [Gemmatimonadota bacterium]